VFVSDWHSTYIDQPLTAVLCAPTHLVEFDQEQITEDPCDAEHTHAWPACCCCCLTLHAAARVLLLLLLLVLLAVVILLSYTLRASSEAPTANNQGLCLGQGEEQRQGGWGWINTWWGVGGERPGGARFCWWSWWAWGCTQDQNLFNTMGYILTCGAASALCHEGGGPIYLWVGGTNR